MSLYAWHSKDKVAERRRLMDKPCKFANNPSGDVWECTCYRTTYCADQRFDYNDDGSVNIVICGLTDTNCTE